ncbi:MAG: flavodoxin-dependent (E)-4-hydroxy-3-methylbut-2-enyl-diphosphate synthase [Coprothermobacterota bacterium]|nr:flavodoxin-dependent (E)-4-hydroxy-3-methylbut-2-enyl-diphosphate synthase [Coprothermobacterota bacterium]
MASFKVKIGNLTIGGGEQIAVQSMLKTDPHNKASSLKQLRRLESVGCELVRMAIPDERAVETFRYLKGRANVPLIADIHFDPSLALKAMEAGADKIRINPGNIPKAGLKKILELAMEKNIPLRIGLNTGSLPKKFRRISPLWEGLILAAEDFLDWISPYNYRNLIFSLKASSIEDTIEAYLRFSKKYDFPLHLGLTEAGPIPEGIVKSTIVLYTLLKEGIGDTIRVSLTAPPEVEAQASFCILESLGLRKRKLEIISCPTCGRTHSSLQPLIRTVRLLENEMKSHKVIAVMGCEVNGPGEAARADLGVSLTKNGAIIFKRGKIIKRVTLSEIKEALLEELNKD